MRLFDLLFLSVATISASAGPTFYNAPGFDITWPPGHIRSQTLWEKLYRRCANPWCLRRIYWSSRANCSNDRGHAGPKAGDVTIKRCARPVGIGQRCTAESTSIQGRRPGSSPWVCAGLGPAGFWRADNIVLTRRNNAPRYAAPCDLRLEDASCACLRFPTSSYRKARIFLVRSIDAVTEAGPCL